MSASLGRLLSSLIRSCRAVRHVATVQGLTSMDSHIITPMEAKAACSWAVVQQTHSQLQCGDTVNLKLFLLRSILVPSLHHVCELWGMHKACGAANRARAAFQSLYDRYLRHICGVKYITASAMLLEELGCHLYRFFGGGGLLNFGTG